MKGEGSQRVKTGPVSKIDEIWLYCMYISSVTENDFFLSLASYLGICDVIKITYPTQRFKWVMMLKTTLYGTFLFVLRC